MQFSAVRGAAVGNSIILLNACGGEAYGLEAHITWLPMSNLTINLGGSWTHIAIRDAGLQSGIYAQCNVTDPVVGGFAQINNNPFLQAPDYLISLSANYSYPLAGGDTLFFIVTTFAETPTPRWLSLIGAGPSVATVDARSATSRRRAAACSGDCA